MAGLVVAAIAVVMGTTVVPTHLTLGGGSIRRSTVLGPDRHSEIAPLSGPAPAHHLRATLARGAFLVALAVVPVVVQWRRPGQHLSFCVAWGVIMLAAAVLGVARLGLVEYAPESLSICDWHRVLDQRNPVPAIVGTATSRSSLSLLDGSPEMLGLLPLEFALAIAAGT